MKKNLKRNIVLALVGIVMLIQFIPLNRENPPVEPDKDFLAVSGIDAESANLLKSACYDCHSHESKYPWYSYVAPASFIVIDHIKEGRKELNFSTWTDYTAKKKDHKLEEMVEALKEGWMPLEGYVAMHAEAKLTDAQRADLAGVIMKIRANAAQIQLVAPPPNSLEVEHEHSEHDGHNH